MIFAPTYPKLENATDNESMDQCVNIIYNNLNQLGQSGNVLQPITKVPSGNLVYQMPTLNNNLVPGLYPIYIPAKYLVSSGAGYNLTLTTFQKNMSTVTIPISPSGDTLTSSNLLFNVFVDSIGNVTSNNWQISGSNSNGSYVKFADGTMICDYYDGTNLRTTSSPTGTLFYAEVYQSFAASFKVGTVPIVTPAYRSQGAILFGSADISGATNIGTYMFLMSVFITGSGYMGFIAKGYWK